MIIKLNGINANNYHSPSHEKEDSNENDNDVSDDNQSNLAANKSNN